MGNIVAIVGRPNVGKSTFFNRLVKNRQAIEEPTSGVTRDRHYGYSHWNGLEFSVIDTGGYVVGSDDIFEEEIGKQVKLAIDEADVIIFLVNIQEGVTPLDEDVAKILRRVKNKKIFVGVNKVDNFDLNANATEFYNLGLGEVYPISAINGSGTGELLDEIIPCLDKIDKDETVLPKLAVIGRPNVGKSSMINALLGTDRNIVTDIAGTTRDAIHTRYTQFGFDFLFVDTAGIRKKAKVHEDIEFYSVMRSIKAIEESDVCILMIDATQGFETQDQNILHLIEKNRKGLVVVVNKWDLVEKDTLATKRFTEAIKEKTAPFTDIPIIFTSTVTKQRILKVLEEAIAVYKRKIKKTPTSQLNELLLPIIESMPPPAHKGKMVKIKYITQLPTSFPSFAFFCNHPQYVKDSYKRFLENKIREAIDLTGVYVQLFFREK
jgi:GTPase